MKPRYFQVSLERSEEPPIGERSRGGGSNALCNLEKWKMSVFLCSTIRPNFKRRDKNDIIATKKICIRMWDGLVLRNEQFIVYKRNHRDRNF